MRIDIEIPEQNYKKGGWILDLNWLKDFTERVNNKIETEVSWEDIEAILLILKGREGLV